MLMKPLEVPHNLRYEVLQSLTYGSRGRNSMVECQLPKLTQPTFRTSTYKNPQ